MTRFRLRPCPRGFVVIECPYLMGEHMCQKLEIARDRVYYLEITRTRFETLFQPLLSGLQHTRSGSEIESFQLAEAGPRLTYAEVHIYALRGGSGAGSGASPANPSNGRRAGSSCRLVARTCPVGQGVNNCNGCNGCTMVTAL